MRYVLAITYVVFEHSMGADILQLNMPVLMYDKDDKSTVMTLEQLLPMSFGPNQLLPTDEVVRR